MIDYEAEVEGILGGPPGKLAFRALCAVLGRAGSPADLVARCEERLAAWPDEVREAPWSWLAALAAGHSKPTWSLVRSLGLGQRSRLGTRDPVLPDPRDHPEVRGVTHLDLGWYAGDQLAALTESLDHWDNLRAIRVAGLTDMDGEPLARLAGNSVVTRLESLDLVSAQEGTWHLGKPRFRPFAGGPWRLRHAGLRAPDLVHLMRSGMVPDLRSAEVRVSDIDEARELAECAELAELDRLTIGFRCGRNGHQPLWGPYFGNVIDQDDDACAALFARADLANLRGLTVRGTEMGLGREGLGERGVDAIVASGILGQLTDLTLELLPVGDAAIARVLDGIDPSRIEKLVLADLVATDVTAEAFVAFPRLRHLDLSRNRLGAEGARRLAADAQLPALEHLDLSGRESGSPYYGCPDVQPVGDAGATAWASSDNATRLSCLKVAATGLGAAGFAALMSSERLAKLNVLDVSHNPMGGWPATARVLRTLSTLNVTDCGLDDDDIEALASVAAPGLVGISLAYNSIGSRGARALASWAVLPRLWELDLHDNIIGDGGLIALATSRAADRLLELDLEQDCWNVNKRRYGTPLPAEVVDQASFPSLDAMFLGIVDEYHGARYSSGFPAHVREELVSGGTARPELVAFLTHLDMEELEDSDDDPELESLRTDHDFRTGRAERYARFVDEAKDFARRMREGDIGWPPPSSETS